MRLIVASFFGVMIVSFIAAGWIDDHDSCNSGDELEGDGVKDDHVVPECAVFVGVSLDGFIARPNGDLHWLMGEGGGDSGVHPFDAGSLSSFSRNARTLSRASREGRPASPCALHEPISVLCALTGLPSIVWYAFAGISPLI